MFKLTDKAKKNMLIMDEVISKKEYQKGYPNWKGIHELKLPKDPGAQKGVTWCNEAANEIACRCGYDTSLLLHPKGIGWTGANDMYKNAWKAILDGRLEKVEGEEIVYYNVNHGDIILLLAHSLIGGSGHIAAVRPYDKPYNYKKGLRISQAGEKNGSFWARYIFNIPELTPVLMVRLKEK